MKHSSTRELFSYWNQQRGERPAPERGDIDPIAIRHALGDIFMLAVDFVDEQRFRLAGTRVCALFCRELKGEPFSALWNKASRQPIQDLLAIIAEDSTGAVAGVSGRAADGAIVDLELLLLPLAHQGHARIRALGVLAAADVPYWIGQNPVQELELGSVRHVSRELERVDFPRRTLTPDGGRLRRGFMVYQGGRVPPANEKAG
jgi:hypothetical protein